MISNCNDHQCRGACDTCNRAFVENRPLPGQTATSFATPERGCSDPECRGDCTWCNRADIENRSPERVLGRMVA